jgi:uncharacterized protein YbjT (DUF2867 family)
MQKEHLMSGRHRILVTGAPGTVGRQVVAQLLDAGVEVRALARELEAARLPDGVEVIGGDLTEPATLPPWMGLRPCS